MTVRAGSPTPSGPGPGARQPHDRSGTARRTPTASILALVTALALAAGCGADADGRGGPTAGSVTSAASGATEAAPVTFEAGEYTIEGPGEIPAGLTEVTLRNGGAEVHHLVFARLEQGVTADDFTGAFAALDPTGVATLLGGPNGVAPGASVSATLPLTPGDYVVACVVPGPDGVSHFMRNMTTTLTVTPSDRPTELPPSDRTVHLREYDFGRGGTELEGFDGTGSLTVVNEGGEMHELTIVHLADAATIDEVVDVAALPMGTPRPVPMPFQGVGGVSLLSRGQSAQIDLDALALPPGRYAFVCFIPSPGDRRTHAAKGMVHEFEIRSGT